MATFVCAACGVLGVGPMCVSCRRQLAPGPSFVSAAGVTVTAALQHHGAARRLVHSLKYGAIVTAAEVLGWHMAQKLPEGVSGLVPLPRAKVRRWKHGIDPAVMLATVVGRHAGIPVVPALRAAAWWPRHAGRGEGRRSRPGFLRTGSVGSGWALIDDVATSGATVDAAAAALDREILLALVATAPCRVRREGSENMTLRV